MNYDETIEYLYNLQPPFHIVGAKAYKPGFDNILKLTKQLGNPQKQFSSIHIAGTNGKGSTSHLLAAVLQSAGYKVGLYTSPHLVDFRERIRINGEMIDQNSVTEFVDKNKLFLETIKPSFFETATAMAFDYFAKNNIDVAVIEVGLGGRLDSTNIIMPELSVITNIGLDHTEFLGNTLESIASEKAGIIKPHIPVVIGESNAAISPVFIEKAGQNDAPIIFAQQQPAMPTLQCELTGEYQKLNKQTVYTSLLELRKAGFTISDEAISYGFRNVCRLTGLHGRWETLQTDPLWICDTGHNSHAFKHIKKQLDNCKYNKLYIVFGMVDDKDIYEVVKLLPPKAYYLFTQAKTKRAIPVEKLAQICNRAGLYGETTTSVTAACYRAQQLATNGDMVYVGGSNYVVGECLNWHKNCNN